LTHCAYDADAQAPTFLKVLDHVTGGSTVMQNYFQKVFGYAMTGFTGEKSFFLAPVG
jgi:phage/plasmid-associated DNA primase